MGGSKGAFEFKNGVVGVPTCCAVQGLGLRAGYALNIKISLFFARGRRETRLL